MGTKAGVESTGPSAPISGEIVDVHHRACTCLGGGGGGEGGVRGQLLGVDSLPPLCGMWRLNMAHQASAASSLTY